MFSERCLWKMKKTSPAGVCEWRLIRFTLSNIDVMFQFVNPRTLDFSLCDVFEAILPSDPFGFQGLFSYNGNFYGMIDWRCHQGLQKKNKKQKRQFAGKDGSA